MEYSPGITLDKFIRNHTPKSTIKSPYELLRGRRSNLKLAPISENEIKPIFKNLVKSVFYLHEIAQICHRDIKLSNILLEKKGKIKLIDYGFSSTVDFCIRGFEGRPMVNQICGTPCYMSPELTRLDQSSQRRKEFYDGKAVDIWALGVCLYKMIHGVFPFGGNPRISS